MPAGLNCSNVARTRLTSATLPLSWFTPKPVQQPHVRWRRHREDAGLACSTCGRRSKPCLAVLAFHIKLQFILAYLLWATIFFSFSSGSLMVYPSSHHLLRLQISGQG